MKFLFLIILLLIYFLSPVIEQLWVEDYSSINSNTHESLLNIYGEPLKPCQNNKNDKMVHDVIVDIVVNVEVEFIKYVLM